MTETVSTRNIFGTFVNQEVDEEIIISVKLGMLTIVTHSIQHLPQKCLSSDLIYWKGPERLVQVKLLKNHLCLMKMST